MSDGSENHGAVVFAGCVDRSSIRNEAMTIRNGLFEAWSMDI